MKTDNRSLQNRAWVLTLAFVFTFVFALESSEGQEGRPRRGRRGRMPNRQQADKKEDKKETSKDTTKGAAKSEILAIVGGDILPVSGPMIRKGTILIEDGKIKEIGQDIEVPQGATVIDAAGRTVTPGFVAINMSRVGIRSTPSGNEKLVDAFDPFDQNIKYSLGVGITTGCVELSTSRGRGRRRRNEGEPDEIFPGLEKPIQEYVTESMLDYGDEDTELCPCCGLPVLPTEPITESRPTPRSARTMAAIKMSYGNLDAMLLKDSVFYNPTPGSLNGALGRHNWRKDLRAARKAIEEEKQEAASKAKSSSAKSSSAKSSSSSKSAASSKSKSSSAKKTRANPDLVKLLKKETMLRIRANSYDEISDLVDLALEFDYQMVIEGGIEAWALAEKIGQAGVEVIFTPRQRRRPQPGNEDNSGSNIESPRIFKEAGIPFAVGTLSNSISMGGLAGRDLSSLPLEAAFAVRGGADEQTCLQALTIVPARMMGLDDRIGSLEKGKDADILILNGGPLDYRTYVEKAIVAGKVSYDRSEDRVYPVYPRK